MNFSRFVNIIKYFIDKNTRSDLVIKGEQFSKSVGCFIQSEYNEFSLRCNGHLFSCVVPPYLFCTKVYLMEWMSQVVPVIKQGFFVICNSQELSFKNSLGCYRHLNRLKKLKVFIYSQTLIV